MKQEKVKKQIIEAANVRFEKYGYGKTTMAEIARDCGMTAGNLYRYFPGKADIITEIAQGCFVGRLDVLKKASKSSDCLETVLGNMVIANLEYMHGIFSQQVHIHELIEFITGQRRELLQQHMTDVKTVIAGIVQKGVESGEFVSNDPMRTAETFFNANIKFFAPHFMVIFPLEELKREAGDVVVLLINGLKKR